MSTELPQRQLQRSSSRLPRLAKGVAPYVAVGSGLILIDLGLGTLFDHSTSTTLGTVIHSGIVGLTAAIAYAGVTGKLRLNRSAQRARALESAVSASTHALFLTNAQGKLTFASRAWLEFTGRTLDVELSASRQELIHPEDHTYWAGLFRTAIEQQTAIEGTYRMRRHDGVYRTIRSVASPRFEDGVFVGLAGMCEDITDAQRDRSDAELSAVLFDTLLSSTPSIMFSIDQNGVFTESKGSGLKGLRLHDNQVVGASIFDDWPHITKDVSRALGGEVVTFSTKELIDGRQVHFRTMLAPRPHGNGAVGFSFDITQEVETQALLATHQDRIRTLLDAAMRVQKSESIHDVLDVVADAIHEAGWERVSVWEYDRSFSIVRHATRGLSSDTVDRMLKNAHSNDERARLFGPEYERFKLSKSYFVPSPHGASLKVDAAEQLSGDQSTRNNEWHADDVAYIPLRLHDGSVLGRINIDTPADRQRPTAEVFQYLESFAGIAVLAIERLNSIERQAVLDVENKLLMESIPVVAWTFDLTRDLFTYVTPQAQDILGYGPDCWTDFESWAEMVHPDDREEARTHCLHQTQLGVDHEMAYRFINPAGETVWVRELVAVEVVDGKPVKLRGIIVDESDRHAMESTMRAEAFRFSAVTGATQDIVFDWDFENDTFWGNRRYHEVYGRDLSSGAIRSVWEETIHDDDRQRVMESLDSFLEGDQTRWEIEYKVIDAKGTVRTVHERCVVTRDAARCAQRLIGVATDITDLVERESELTTSRTLLQSTIDGLAAEIAVLNSDGNVILTNWSWSTGNKSLRSIEGRLRGRAPNHTIVNAYDALNEFLNDTATTLRIPHPIWDAERGRWYQIRASAFGEYPNRNVVLSREDVSAIQTAQQGLAASEARYRTIVDHQDEYVMRFTPDLELTFVNNSYCALRGASERMLLGSSLHEVVGQNDSTASQGYQAKHMLKCVRKLENIEDLQRDEMYLDKPDGKRVWVSWTHQAIRDESGALVEVQSVGRDVSHQVEAEKELVRSNELQSLLLSELNHRVKNTLGGLISLISAQAATSGNVGEFAQKLSDRIRSIVSIHSMLSDAQWTKLTLRGIFNELVPQDLKDRITLEGPQTDVRGDIATPLGMVIQELTSNALKYGAWSQDTGEVNVRWQHDDAGITTLRWIESGGPPIDSQPGMNLGSKLIKGFTEFELRGSVELEFHRSGATHTFRIKVTPESSPAHAPAEIKLGAPI